MSLKGITFCQHKFFHKFSMVFCSSWKVKMFYEWLWWCFWSCFQRTKSIATIIQSRYGDKILKMVRKLEKLDFKLRKAILARIMYMDKKIFRWGTHLYMSLFPSVRLSICLSVCHAPHLRNHTSSDHNFWYIYVKGWYLQAFFFSFFENFDFLGC